jgi:hypothetical protein
LPGSFLHGFNCDADEVVDNETHYLTGGTIDWQATIPESSLMGTPVSGANSVLFQCKFGADPSVATVFYFDQFYVSQAPTDF